MASKKQIVTLKSDELTLEKMEELFTVNHSFISGNHSNTNFVHHNISSKNPDVDYRIALSCTLMSSAIILMRGKDTISLCCTVDIPCTAEKSTGHCVETEAGSKLKKFLHDVCVFYCGSVDAPSFSLTKKKLLIACDTERAALVAKCNDSLILGRNDDGSPQYNYNTFNSPITTYYQETQVDEEDKTRPQSFPAKIWMGAVKAQTKLNMYSFYLEEFNQIIYTTINVPNDNRGYVQAKDISSLEPYVYEKGDSATKGKTYFKLLFTCELLLPTMFWKQGKCSMQLKFSKLNILDKVEQKAETLNNEEQDELAKRKEDALQEFGIDEKDLYTVKKTLYGDGISDCSSQLSTTTHSEAFDGKTDEDEITYNDNATKREHNDISFRNNPYNRTDKSRKPNAPRYVRRNNDSDNERNDEGDDTNAFGNSTLSGDCGN